MNRFLILTVLMLLCLGAAAEPVKKNERLNQPMTVELPQVCKGAKPPTSQGLSAMLRWDLCPPAVIPQSELSQPKRRGSRVFVID